MIKIKTIQDVKAVSDKAIEKKLTYFSVLFAEESSLSSCFFTPTSKLPNARGMIFVNDYEKVMKVLLSHPKIRELEYDEKENVISCVFSSPYAEEGEKGFEF